jgi:dTDP-4-dehydrorhamnose 3,5-epimerase
MKIISVKPLTIPAILTIKFARFTDNRGYFTEPYRQSDFENYPDLKYFKQNHFVQNNESYSVKKVTRGLHFQWNPFMGKLVRTVNGHMLDLVLDIRQGSPTLGKIIAWDMPSHSQDLEAEWIWIPPGFAHGNFFLEDTTIEYLCTGEYSQGYEAGISPLSKDLDWSLCEPSLQKIFVDNETKLIISEKDKQGLTLKAWMNDVRANNFTYQKLKTATERQVYGKK